MKRLFLFALLGCFSRLLLAQDSLNMTRLSRWDDETLYTDSWLGLQYSGCWGLATGGREYAILGAAEYVLFFDITQPAQPELIGKFAGSQPTVWREFKSYKNRVYAVSDGTTEGLMIFDLTNAPDTIVRTYWSSEFFSSAHTITLDTTSGRIYLNGSNVAELVVLDISQNPDQPSILAASFLAGGYIHDSYVRNDTIYASSGGSGYFIYDFTDPLHPDTLASTATGGYNHNSWLNSEGTYAYYTEEIPTGRPVRIVDLQNLANGEIEPVGAFLDRFSDWDTSDFKDAIPHNVYIRDNLLFNSQYEDGLVVYDISDPLTPVLVAHYDTHPENVYYTGYKGNWGNYPWLPSGTIITGDMQNGLQLLKMTGSVGTAAPASPLNVQVFPNPAGAALTIATANIPGEWSYRLTDLTGRCLLSGQAQQAQQTLSLKNCSAGLYFLAIQTEDGRKAVRKIAVE